MVGVPRDRGTSLRDLRFGVATTRLAPGESGVLFDVEFTSDGFTAHPYYVSISVRSYASLGETNVDYHVFRVGIIEHGNGYYIAGAAHATPVLCNLRLDFFGKDDLGPLAPRFDAFHLDQLTPGVTFEYETLALSGPITNCVDYPSFIDHARTALAPDFSSSPRDDARREIVRREAIARRLYALGIH